MSDNLGDARKLLELYDSATDGSFPDYVKQITATLSATPVPGKTAVFYSGLDAEGPLGGHPDFTTLGQTEVGRFLHSKEFLAAVEAYAPESAYIDGKPDYDHPYHVAIGGGSENSVWGEASQRFALEVTGDVNFVGPNYNL